MTVGREHRLPPEDQEGAQGRHRGQRCARRPALLDLDDYLDRKPAKLSGGQRQRVAMGRAIVRQPQVFLMDEPLSNLDAKLRVQTRTQIAALQRRLGVTTVYVTHDQVEAMTMGDRVAVLQGRRAATVRDAARAVHPTRQRLRRRVHRLAGDEPAVRPASTATRRDFGSLTVAAAPRRRRRPLTSDGSRSACARRACSRRPRRAGLAATVDVVEELGSEPYLYCTAPVDGADVHVVVRTRRPQRARARAMSVTLVARARIAPPVRHRHRRTTPRLKAAATRWRFPSSAHRSVLGHRRPRRRGAPGPPEPAVDGLPVLRRRARGARSLRRALVPEPLAGDGAATAAKWCSTRRSTMPRSGRSASTGPAR